MKLKNSEEIPSFFYFHCRKSLKSVYINYRRIKVEKHLTLLPLSSIMPLTGKEMLRLFLSDGWQLDRINGSHHILKKNDKTVTIPVHSKELGKGLEQKLLKLGGFK